MLPYQKRAIREKAELDRKRERLDAFIASETFDTLSYIDQRLLALQAAAMAAYAGALGQRIERFSDGKHSDHPIQSSQKRSGFVDGTTGP